MPFPVVESSSHSSNSLDAVFDHLAHYLQARTLVILSGHGHTLLPVGIFTKSTAKPGCKRLEGMAGRNTRAMALINHPEFRQRG
jgi:hypothetical protein